MQTQTSKRVDTLIIGGGVAGLFLARSLMARGQSVLVVHDPDKPGAFGAAVGLLNPVRGQRLTLPWHASTTFPHAFQCYRELQKELESPLFRELPVLRIVESDQEWNAWMARKPEIEAAGFKTDEDAPPDCWKNTSLPAFVVRNGGAVDVPALRSALIKALGKDDGYLEAPCEHREIRTYSSGIIWKHHDKSIEAAQVVLCGGIADLDSHLVPRESLRALKGESLAVKIADISTSFAYVCGYHLAPVKRDLWLCGGTRESGLLDTDISLHARDELEGWLRANLSAPWTTVSQFAGIRPSTPDRIPVVGASPYAENVFMLNGLGSQGFSWGPWLADQLAEHIVSGAPLPSELNPARFQPPARLEPRFHAVDIAREHATSVLSESDIAIDLTTGNGGDTCWLAEAVGSAGKVYGFDIQPTAIHATERRLESAGLGARVALFCVNHAAFAGHVQDTHVGRIGAVVANLGYLPGSSRSVVTKSASTIPALSQSLELLRPGGVLVVVIYTGHKGGSDELSAIETWSAGLSGEHFDRLWERAPGGRAKSPQVLVVKRLLKE